MQVTWARWRGRPAARGFGAWHTVRRGAARGVWMAGATVAGALCVIALTYLARPQPAAWPAGPVTGAEAASPPGGPAAAPQTGGSLAALRRALQLAAGGPGAAPRRPPWWTPAVGAAAQQSGVPAALLAAVVEAESQGDASAVSPAGAKGLMQLMPSTAAALGVSDVFDSLQNADAGAHYLATWLRTYSGGRAACVTDPEGCPQALRLALAAYNAGPGAVRRYGGVPPYPQTQRYIREVTALYRTYAGEG